MNYRSCSCFQCRHASSARKGFNKKNAHKRFRKASREALSKGNYEIPFVHNRFIC